MGYPLYIYSLGISYELGLGEVLKVDNWSRNQNDYSYSIVILQKDKYLEDLLIDIGLIK